MTSNVAMVLVTSAGSASDALNSSTNIATCKPKGYPSVKQPKRWTFPEPRFKRGAHGRIGLMPVPMWWSFLSAFLVLLLHRLVLAFHVVFVEIGACGIRLVCRL